MSDKDENIQVSEADRSMMASSGVSNVEPPPELGKEIAKQLKVLYGRQVAEPLPDKFTVLLEKLAKAERKE